MKIKIGRNKPRLNMIKCNGTACISVDNNMDRYYVQFISRSRKLKPKIYKK